MDAKPPFVLAHVVAGQLGLPESFIRKEAQAGQLPHIRIGRRLYFNADAVAAALKDGKCPQIKEGDAPDA